MTRARCVRSWVASPSRSSTPPTVDAAFVRRSVGVFPAERRKNVLMASDGEFYWCLDHKRVETATEGCTRARQLGPYPTADAARHWKEQFDSRNEALDREDHEWEGEDD